MDVQDRRARREEHRRAIRRRRRRIGLLATVIVLVVVVVASATGGSGGGGSQSAHSTRPRSARLPADAQGRRARPVGDTPGTGPVPGRPGTDPVPILMYHVIAAAPAGAPFPGLYVTPSEFAAQMQALKGAGWHAVTLDQVEAYWRRGVALGAGKPIVLSFDNGYQSQYTQALPVLRRLGWVGDENLQLTGLPPSQGGLGENEIRGLIAAGWELDTQGISHADLITLNAEQLHYQVADARRMLQQRYGIPVNWFCYPSGHYDAKVLEAVKSAGYTGSTTVIPGWAHPTDDPYRLHRLRVLGGTTPSELLELIASIREDPPAPASYAGT
jgi:peptidoglycan/xylan/chitin deacetylase (PgdA/CDA1 family)